MSLPPRANLTGCRRGVNERRFCHALDSLAVARVNDSARARYYVLRAKPSRKEKQQ
jgi:hypothetical protein